MTAPAPLRRLLVANRGEIACRVIRAARALGIETVAVYSEADREAPHVRLADAAIPIGPAPARDSYLSIPRLIEAAQLAQADAVHPGYGFLSENADFAAACLEAGLAFVGPPPDAIRSMGNKAEAKRLMIAAGISCIPGYQDADQSDTRLQAEARRIGYPVMVKAAAGGGGRGMRLVGAPRELRPALGAARAEALAAFGSDELILERGVPQARHVEIQILADRHGHVIHLGERDCSVQRRHQKVIEEAPSPAIDPALRARMGEAAVAAARAIGYEGAGTIEFLVGADGAFHFMEMNTRIQVEHPVTELVTGVDLVTLQLRIAAGEPLPFAQPDIALRGHAIEARLYAEDPARGFLPQTGRILAWLPPRGAGIRVDDGIESGSVVSGHYDAMLAKIIAHGANREEARTRLIAALERTVLLGIPTNRRFLIECLEHPVFASGRASTTFLAEHPLQSMSGRPSPQGRAARLAGALLYRATSPAQPPLFAGWRPTGPALQPMRLTCNGAAIELAVGGGARRFETMMDGTAEALSLEIDSSSATGLCGAERIEAGWAVGDHDGAPALHLALGRDDFEFRDAIFLPKLGEARQQGDILAPMNGSILSVDVAPGDRVAKGQILVVLEAMKMRHEITAPGAGSVIAVAVKPGDQAQSRRMLVALELDGAREAAAT